MVGSMGLHSRLSTTTLMLLWSARKSSLPLKDAKQRPGMVVPTLKHCSIKVLGALSCSERLKVRYQANARPPQNDAVAHGKAHPVVGSGIPSGKMPISRAETIQMSFRLVVSIYPHPADAGSRGTSQNAKVHTILHCRRYCRYVRHFARIRCHRPAGSGGLHRQTRLRVVGGP
jgi:hypothetical protein